MGLPFTCIESEADEDFGELSDPCSITKELAVRKVQKAIEKLKSEPLSIQMQEPPLWVCGADTLIALDGKIYGKPTDRGDASLMIRTFAGRTHEVISAVALYSMKTGKTDCRSVTSAVSFAPLSEKEIEWYLDSGEWQGAAGAYKIQGLASCFITGIQGSYSSIVGLPLREFYVMLKDNGYAYGY